MLYSAPFVEVEATRQVLLEGPCRMCQAPLDRLTALRHMRGPCGELFRLYRLRRLCEEAAAHSEIGAIHLDRIRDMIEYVIEVTAPDMLAELVAVEDARLADLDASAAQDEATAFAIVQRMNELTTRGAVLEAAEMAAEQAAAAEEEAAAVAAAAEAASLRAMHSPPVTKTPGPTPAASPMEELVMEMKDTGI